MPDPDAIQSELSTLVGRKISGRYRLDALIGIGGMGAVFRARHLMLDRDVAIKVLHPELTNDTEIAARFDREARSASRLDHPNCLQVTDSGTIEGTHGARFIVMQLLEGAELTTHLGEPIPPLEAAEMMLQILRGLEHAHEHGVVHRDLKPENVFVTKDHEGNPILKIVDFGIAKIVSGTGSDDTMTQMGIVFGTPQYMSPEQATGMEVDARADLYSAGIIFYEMLTGKPPFEADDPVALVRMQVTQEPAPLPASLPASLRAFVERLLAKQRDERYSSAGEARKALEAIRDEIAIAEGVPLAHAPAGSVAIPVSGPAAARSAARPLAAGAAAVLGLGFLAWALSRPSPAREHEDRPERPAAAADDLDASVSIEVAGGGPADGQLAELDRLLLQEDLDAAEKLLNPLLDRFPEDARLLWRQGKLLSKRPRRRAQALASYGDAIERDPSLLDDKDFYAEIMALLRQRGLQKEALDLALRKMGKHAHPFLLELVNRKKKALSYADRHRALDELRTDPANENLIDVKLNAALDLWQAKDSLAPCRNYAAALAYIEQHPDPYFENALRKAPLPAEDEEAKADPTDAEVCAALPARRDAVLSVVESLAQTTGGPPAEDGDATPPGEPSADPAKKAGSSKRRRKRKSASKKPAKCKRFLVGLADPDCR